MNSAQTLRELTILAGRDKSGEPEGFGSLVLVPGDLVALVGPTGAGKSRLLADIEWLAQGDSPSGRKVLLNGQVRTANSQFHAGSQLVAQLSQTMSFMVDLQVEPFLLLHAKSRQLAHPEQVVQQVLMQANNLAGEPFDGQTPLAALSGGQSRALMIADTAIVCKSPIVLIDEIENAGIDRRRALELLVEREKIVLMATHDPLLALMAQRRIVVQNGGIRTVVERTPDECELLAELETLDARFNAVRQSLRKGEPLF